MNQKNQVPQIQLDIVPTVFCRIYNRRFDEKENRWKKETQWLEQWTNPTIKSQAQIDTHFKETKDPAIAVVTGKVTNLTVIDFDTKSDDMIAELSATNPTYCVETKNGFHLYYQFRDDPILKNGAGRFGNTVDVRSEGGVIFAPPTPCYDIFSDNKINEFNEDGMAILRERATPSKQTENIKTTNSRNDSLFRKACGWVNEYSEQEVWNRMVKANKEFAKGELEEKELEVLYQQVLKYKGQEGSAIPKETQSQEIASEILHDGTIIEMLYNQRERTTSLAIYNKDGDLKIRKVFDYEGVMFKPHPPTKDLLKSNVLLFPSEPKEYGSQVELITTIQAFIHRYLSVSPFFEKIASYYALFSWIHDDFNELPYLRGLGDYGTGKSRMLQVIGSICYLPIFANGATTVSPIFRILNDFHGTLILDEADFKMSDTTAEMIKILNSGFMKGMSVLRSESNNKKSFDVKAYNVFGAKIIATRHLYKDTALESRMITEDMNLNFPRPDVPYNIPDCFWDEALDIRNQLLMFRFRNKGKSKIKPELEDRSIEPRLNQIAVPLMSIIDDDELIQDIKKQIKEYNENIKTDRTLGYHYQILESICELIDSDYSHPTMKQIAEVYNRDLGYQETVTAKKMGYFVRKMLDLKTEKTRDGYVLSENNREKVEILRKRYGIKKNGEDVNNVNVKTEETVTESPIENLFN
jgi:hypothetical protein